MQSESWLTSEGVCSLTRGGLPLSVILLSEVSREETLAADTSPQTSGRTVMISKDKTSLSALCSHLASVLISFSCLTLF